MVSEQKYIVRGERNPRGPFAVAELRQLFEQGLITADAECWRDGLKAWIPVASVLGRRAKHNSRPASDIAKAQLLASNEKASNSSGQANSDAADDQVGSDSAIPESWKYPARLCLATFIFSEVLINLVAYKELWHEGSKTAGAFCFFIIPMFSFFGLPFGKAIFFDMPMRILRSHRSKTLTRFARSAGIIPLFRGVALLLVGVLLTGLTFSRVEHKGGLYIVFTGMIFGGLALASRGLGILLTGSPQVGTLLVIYGMIGGILLLVLGLFRNWY